MHFELICGAMKYVSNRFMLAAVAAKATRKLRRPYARIEDTFNDVLVRLIHLFPSSIEERGLHKSQLPRNCNRLRASSCLVPVRLVPVSNAFAATLRSSAPFNLIRSRTTWENPSTKLFIPTATARGIHLTV
jgi:hypothetical protein